MEAQLPAYTSIELPLDQPDVILAYKQKLQRILQFWSPPTTYEEASIMLQEMAAVSYGIVKKLVRPLDHETH